jgi:hypothetical protein
VAESYHDDGSLIPAFSSWDTFLDVKGAEETRETEETEGDVVSSPSLTQDPASPLACFRTAREQLSAREFATATALLEKAVETLPEYTEALELLVAQYRRERESEAAIRIALRALRSPPCFGKSAVQALRWLAGQNACPSELENDPLWRHRRDLRFRFGGEKANDDYRVLQEAVREYLETGKTIEGICLLQTFGELMYRETTSFRERYGFHPERHMDYLREVCEKAGHPRTL